MSQTMSVGVCELLDFVQPRWLTEKVSVGNFIDEQLFVLKLVFLFAQLLSYKEVQT